MTILRKEVIGGQTLILGDCMEVMPTLGRFDAVVTDPPFGIKRDKGFGLGGYGKRGKKRLAVKRYAGGWDHQRPPVEAFTAMLEAASSHIIWGGQFFADLLPAQGKWLIWDKCQTMPSYGDGELAWSNLPGDAVKKFTLSLNGIVARGETGAHPTQKPVALMEWCLGFLPAAQTVLDPFMGSASTLVACQRLGRSGTGIERDPTHFETACKRVEEATRQADLFVAPAVPKFTQEALL